MPIRKQSSKQITIKKAFKRAHILQSDDTEELQEEIKLLEQRLKQKHNECFNLQIEKYRPKKPTTKRSTSIAGLPVIQTETLTATNEVERLKDAIYRTSMLTGMEVQSFEEDDHCTVVFHMQHCTDNVVKHGLKIDLRNGRQHIIDYSLPLGFNLSAVLEGYDSVMTPKCLGAIRNALITYYNRLDQFEQLQKSIFMDAQLFKTLDASHIEISVTLYDVRDPDEDTIYFILVMKYRVHDIRPKQIHIKHIDGPDHAAETLLQQCVVFKNKPLLKAFDEAFVTGVGPYKLVDEEMAGNPEKETRRRPKPHRAVNCNNDDTFRPEDCSDPGDDEEE